MNEEMIRVFWKNTKKSDGCWVWVGERDSRGFGRVWVGRKSMSAHRVSFVLHNGGKDITNKVVQATCKNRLCVNPAHLELMNITEQRLWRKIDKTSTCWNWTGHCFSFSYEGRDVRPRRAVYEMLRGVDSSLCVVGKCGNERCVNPDHQEVKGHWRTGIYAVHEGETKKCKKCNRVKNVNEFYITGRNRSSFTGACKKCLIAYSNNYHRVVYGPIIEEEKREKLRLREDQASSQAVSR